MKSIDIRNCKRILIVGDSCRGKSTMGEFLSKSLNLPHTDLDDFFWVKKFTIKREKAEQLELVKKFLAKNSEWIIEGTTRDMMGLCLKDSDLIIHLWFKSIFEQLFCITKRSLQKKERFNSYFDLCYTTVLKRYKWGKSNKGLQSIKELISAYPQKVVELNTWKEIERFKDNIASSY